MLPRQRRLTTELVEQIMLSGKIFVSPILTLTAMKSEAKKNRFAAIAPKKIFKTAVERNKVRRRLYAAMDKSFLERVDMNFNRASFNCVIMAKLGMAKLTKPQITAALVDIFVQSGIIK